MKPEIILIGGGGHCKSVIDVLEQENRYKIAGIVDKKERIGEHVLGYEVIGSDDELASLFKQYKYALVTLGQIESCTLRKKLFRVLKDIGYTLPVIVSPLGYVSKHAEIEEGTVVMHHACVNAAAQVGKNCIINTKALIEHDSVIGDNCHISTAGVVNGGVRVADESFYGSNATSKEGVKVGGFIKAGSVAK